MTEVPGAAICTCGHERDAHLHYRRGRDCALCDCARWSGGNRLTWLRRRGFWRHFRHRDAIAKAGESDPAGDSP